MTLSRREFLGAAVSAAACTLNSAPTSATPAAAPRHRRAGYGAAVATVDLDADPGFADVVAQYCTEIVPAYELKWETLRPKRDAFAFEKGDRLLDFARRRGLKMRGHNLVWYYGLPAWANDIADAATAERELVRHIETVVSHYRGKLTSWDVVNEPIPDNPTEPSARRECLWSRFLGQDYIKIALKAAAAADPAARLTLNEYDIEFAEDPFPMKREAFRRLILSLLEAGAPLHAVGVQCHLRGAKAIDFDGLALFVEEMRAAGLDIYVTELDVIDIDLPAPAAERDAIVGAQAERVLSAIASAGPIDTLLTWGLSDKYSWISHSFPRADHLPNRPLPLDDHFRPKPLMAAIEKFTRAAV